MIQEKSEGLVHSAVGPHYFAHRPYYQAEEDWKCHIPCYDLEADYQCPTPRFLEWHHRSIQQGQPCIGICGVYIECSVERAVARDSSGILEEIAVVSRTEDRTKDSNWDELDKQNVPKYDIEEQ